MSRQRLGTIISGSLADGFTMRIDGNTDLEQIKTGKFVSIVGIQYRFFSLVTDLTLAVSHPDILLFPPTAQEHLLGSILKQRDVYATAKLTLMLMVGSDSRPVPVKTIPPHFADVFEASEGDITGIFGTESHPSKRFFAIGTPLDMTIPICVDLQKLTERSNGIFGKTGTGKTFLTRLVLAGMIKQKKAVTLIFDMHSEYGLQARKEGGHNIFVKGLKSLFGSRVIICSLDPAATRRRGASPDIALTFAYEDMHIEDILALQDELNLHPTAVEAAYLLAATYKRDWLTMLLRNGHNAKEFAQEIGSHPESIAALYRKLRRIEKLPFFVQSSTVGGVRTTSVIDQIMEYIDKEVNVIVEFGNFNTSFVYLLVANIMSRRIHHAYVAKTERFLGSQLSADEPKKLMIVIEEAHKFLNPVAARQTIFGTIAREMRKYYVSLCIVDQRPSGIDPEVLSQIGTKIIASLSDERDIQAVLTGVSNGSTLRTILAALDTKKQALLVGHALPMPVVIQTREYDEAFYAAMGVDDMAITRGIPLNTLIDQIY